MCIGSTSKVVDKDESTNVIKPRLSWGFQQPAATPITQIAPEDELVWYAAYDSDMK